MDLCASGELRAAWRLRDDLDEALGAAYVVSLFADFDAALRMDYYFDARIFCADVVHVLGQEALMDGAVALPENDLGFAQTIWRVAAHDLERIPHGHVRESNSHSVGSVAS